MLGWIDICWDWHDTRDNSFGAGNGWLFGSLECFSIVPLKDVCERPKYCLTFDMTLVRQ